MDLSINPYQIIACPKFGQPEFNKHIEERWKTWKSQIKHVHDVFSKLQNRKKSMGAESREFEAFLSTLRMSPDYIQKEIRTIFSYTASVSGSSIIEGARRFLVFETCPELDVIDKDGWMPWERDILCQKK